MPSLSGRRSHAAEWLITSLMWPWLAGSSTVHTCLWCAVVETRLRVVSWRITEAASARKTTRILCYHTLGMEVSKRVSLLHEVPSFPDEKQLKAKPWMGR